MRFASVPRLAIALLLLISAFSSAPVGSLEQGMWGSGDRLVHVTSIPSTHTSAGPRIEKQALDRARFTPPQHPFSLSIPSTFYSAAALHAGTIRCVGPPDPSCPPPPRPCERLPYHATAPPVWS